MSVTSPAGSKAQTDQTEWYKDAIIYQMHVRSFCDSDGDGIGDFRGLKSKLDYVQELGVTAIWLMPFYPSPLRDEGYDIADYTGVNPMYGSVDDFRAVLDEAHRRGLRVITELVINHTSDQHAWFQRARRAPPGSTERDFYVWSDQTDKYRSARIIFQDFETSNWTYDPIARSHFWHRFYSHQPDLNFDNPAVHAALCEVADFWLGMGVDGLRLDAIPYLYERDGTNCENLPETHRYLKDLRAYIDRKYPGRMLLAEANQWPEDAALYFGEGDECHMNFHFPLMPRLFMAVHGEDRFPIIDILRQTPEIPANCQWGIFLRNHDELTLEMVTDEERHRMYKAYADDPQARVNLGIRRRLAPLLKNNRRKLELINGLLMSLPGTPILYYGDEIEMGDNIYLKDRDSVRTPMQWSPDRNAGFSTANPQQLYLPTVTDPEYHYTTHNVETMTNSPHSFLWWMRRLIRLRRQFPALARGTIEFLTPENPKVLAFLREWQGQTILVLANLSRFTQFAELELSRFRGQLPLEVFGQTPFPKIGELPYFVTLGPQAFLWFELKWPAGDEIRYEPQDLPEIVVAADWRELLASHPEQAAQKLGLAAFFRKHRWFAGKSRSIQDVALVDWFHFRPQEDPLTEMSLLLIETTYLEGEPDVYALLVLYATGKRADNILSDHPSSGICRVMLSDRDEQGVLCDASAEAPLWNELLRQIALGGTIPGKIGEIRGFHTAAFERIGDNSSCPMPTIHARQQSNSSAHFGHTGILKVFRRIAEGVNPELEIGRALESADPAAPIAPLTGWLEYQVRRKTKATFAVLQQFVPNQGDAWTQALNELGLYCDRVMSDTSLTLSEPQPATLSFLLEQARQPPTPSETALVGHYLTAAELLGKRTGELHLSLAGITHDPAFAPEEFTKLYQRSLYQSMRTATVRSFQLLRTSRGRLAAKIQPVADRVLMLEQPILEQFQQLLTRVVSSRRIRVHGDYHLGQVLSTGSDFVIIDFEGEPDRSIAERRIKRTPLRDVAGMLRSFHYASHADLMGLIPGLNTQDDQQKPRLRAWLQVWYAATAAAFLRGYLRTTAGVDWLPRDPAEWQMLLEVCVLEKLVYELAYELNSRPDWTIIPLTALLEFEPG